VARAGVAGAPAWEVVARAVVAAARAVAVVVAGAAVVVAAGAGGDRPQGTEPPTGEDASMSRQRATHGFASEGWEASGGYDDAR
jgi:hypothetical protein